MLNQLSIGISALRAAQIGLNVVGNNIANANTPGYHRQVALFTDRPYVNLFGHELGTGVDTSRIKRVHSNVIESAVIQHMSDSQQVLAQLDTARQIETFLAPTSGGLNDQLNDLFNRFEELSARPHDTAARGNVVRTAQQLTSLLNQLTKDVDGMANRVESELHAAVNRVNTLAENIQSLNIQIRTAKNEGGSANDLLDRRDALVSEMATYVSVAVDYDKDTVSLGGGTILIGNATLPGLELRQDADGWSIFRAGGTEPAAIEGGAFGGMFAVLNETLPKYREQLDQLATGLIATFDAQHVQGVGMDGPFNFLNGQRRVENVDANLTSLDTALPIIAGTLSVGVVDSETGQRMVHLIDVDPSVDTVRSVAAKISAIDGLQAVVDPTSRTLSIVAAHGHRFDFTGLPQTVPDRSRFQGTSEITVGGVYQGSQNSTLEFSFTGAGQIGVTEGLQLEVRNQTGQILQTVNVGHGYSPGDAIKLDNGISLNLSSGTIVADDAFSVEAVANADETGFLVALGMNTFFVGDSADTLAINSDILESTDRLATSLSGDPGDSENLTAMINRRAHTSAVLGHHTVEEFVGELISLVGADVQALTEATETLEVVGHNLEAQRAGLSGVDPDEEVVKMLQFQRAYEAAARYLNVVNETTIELLSII